MSERKKWGTEGGLSNFNPAVMQDAVKVWNRADIHERNNIYNTILTGISHASLTSKEACSYIRTNKDICADDLTEELANKISAHHGNWDALMKGWKGGKYETTDSQAGV